MYRPPRLRWPGLSRPRRFLSSNPRRGSRTHPQSNSSGAAVDSTLPSPGSFPRSPAHTFVCTYVPINRVVTTSAPPGEATNCLSRGLPSQKLKATRPWTFYNASDSPDTCRNSQNFSVESQGTYTYCELTLSRLHANFSMRQNFQYLPGRTQFLRLRYRPFSEGDLVRSPPCRFAARWRIRSALSRRPHSHFPASLTARVFFHDAR